MQQINSIEAMNRELQFRTQAVGLEFDCGCGGSFNSTIAVVAEAPGEREVAAKLPLVGNTGKALFDITRKYGISRTHVYSTNVVKRKLPQAPPNKYGKPVKSTIARQELEHWRAICIDELCLLPNLRYVLLLGAVALEAFTGDTSIKQWRGSIIDIGRGDRTFPALVTYNPAIIFHDPKAELILRFDVGKFNRLIKGETKKPQFDELINPSFNEAMDYIDHCKDVDSPIALDIETIAGETACIGLAPSVHGGMCINFRTTNENVFTISEERQLRLAFQGLFNTPGKRFITQNGSYDASWLWFKDRLRLPGIYFDTLLAHHTLYPPLPHNLGFLTAQYTDHPYYKDDGKFWGEKGDIDTFWRYNVKDLCITYMVYERELEELHSNGLADFFFSHVMRLQPHLIRMTVNGIKADEELKNSLNENIGRDVDTKRQIFIDAARHATAIPDYECNPNSPRDIVDLFFTKLRLVGRGQSTDEENRKRIAAHPRTSEEARHMLRALDEYKKAHKFYSTYVKSRLDSDGRFRCEYKQYGVASAPGRLSSSSTPWDTGMNLQNQPEQAKPMFIADEGYMFTYFDAAQIEARIVAWKAKIPKWKAQFELARHNPGTYDAHRALASEMYRIPYDDIPAFDIYPDDWPNERLRGTKTLRFTAKRCRHGLNYRMAADRLASTTGLPMREAEEAYRIYHRVTPQIMQWWDATRDEVRRSGRLTNAFGRRWILLEKFGDEALDSIIAFYPQSTAGDHISRVVYLCEDDPRWPPNARMILNVHDALIALHRIEDKELVALIMKEHGETPIYVDGEELIVPVDMAQSVADADGIHRWSTLKKIKPPMLKSERMMWEYMQLVS